ncbi:Carboxymuconolactone decarboxylase family protein [Anatilimnocola aggregata]|uniref:Carboxymuconolactone decarboxylase family protein n=1 Tax=Anatilimnocola aggregata TaxID=2528021 RepID=A0A517YFJ3_9BACT|nr:carboxymuconolactone decarboxylase family protein [Anatilimnocola aggregata]QDU28981.1 Carboxymuconolactone decarboxylase family protein [Anatilimnocola aggregata]
MTTRSPEHTSEQHPAGSSLVQKNEATTAADDSSTKYESPATPKKTSKPKRTLTAANFLKTTANCAISFPILIRSVFSPKTSKALREKVMLGVTAINDCRFCAWGHSHWAASQGVSLEEVNQILSNQDNSLAASDPAEAAAILFGQHYAEQLDEIDPESVKNLHNYFSSAQVREIVGYVYFITFTNLSGNTVDALLDRVRGRGRPITFFEGVAGAALAPILFALVALVKLGKVLGTDKRRAARHRVSEDVPPHRDSPSKVLNAADLEDQSEKRVS